MAITIDIKTTGVNTLERAAAAFDKMSSSSLSADKAFAALSVTEQKLVRYFKELSSTTGQSAKEISLFAKGLGAVEKSMSALAHAKQPFLQFIGPTKEYTLLMSTLRKELIATAAVSAQNLGNKGFVKSLIDTKAAIVLQQQLNMELEKAAGLRANNAMLGGAPSNTALGANVSNLKVLQAETQKLVAENAKLLASNNSLVVSDEKLAASRAMLKQGAVQSQMNIDTRVLDTQAAALAKLGTRFAALKGSAALPVGAINQMKVALAQATRELELNGASQRTIIAAASQTAATYEKLAAAELKAAAAARQLAAANASQAKTVKGNLLGNLGTQIKELEKLKVPTETINRLKTSLASLKTSFANTGKINAAGFTGIIRDLNSVNTTLPKSSKAFTDWGKNAKYAIGGVARSMGAMTYSYAALAPLLAGIAAGSAVKKVYELGAAFEYTTTYVDALSDSLNKMSLPDLQSGLMNFEGLRQGPVELAEGMKEFAKAGVEASESIGQIEEMSKFATVAEMDLGAATKMVIGQSEAFGTTFSDAANMIGAAALSSATDITELGNAMAFTTELASVAKVSLADVATGMAVMANRGIRGCYDRDTEVLTKSGWKLWEDVTYDDEFATYNDTTGEIEYQAPDRLIRYHHTGKMYKVANKGIDLCVTPDHRMYVRKAGRGDYEVLTAKKVAGKRVSYKTGGLGWAGEKVREVVLPGFSQNRANWTKEVAPTSIKAEDWATFLGWYIADGHCSKSKGCYRVVITKTGHKPKMQAKMRRLFDRLPWKYNYTKSTGQFCFTNQQFFNALHPLGQVYDKHIPQYAKDWDKDLLRILYDSLMECDGDKENKYYTSSLRLRDDVQEIALKLGYATLSRRTMVKGETSTFTGGRQIVAGADGWKVSVTGKRTNPEWDPSAYRGAHGARLKGSKIEIFEGWVDYDDEVFCAEVPNGLLIVRRNGRAIVSGNSKAATAMRTSILKMAAPTSQFKEQLDALGISWSAFTKEGKITDLKTMFTELQRVTEYLPDEQRVGILKELFSLRAMKGGIALLEGQGKAWDDLNKKIKESVEGVTFIEKKYEALQKTVKASLERLGVEGQKTLLKAFDGEAAAGMLESLTDTVASDSVVNSLRSVISISNEVGSAMTMLLNIVASMPLDIADVGILAYMMFGKSPMAKFAIGTSKILQEVKKLQAGTTDAMAGAALKSVFGENFNPEVMKQQGMLENLSGAWYHFKLGIEGSKDAVVDLTESMMKAAKSSPLGLAVGPDLKQQDFGGGLDAGVQSFAKWALEAKQVKSITDQISLDRAAASSDVWAGKLGKVAVELDKIVQGKDLNPEQIGKIEKVLMDNLVSDNLKEMQKDINDLNFSTLVAEMGRSSNAADVFQSKLMSVRKAALEYASGKGQTTTDDFGETSFTAEGQKYYEAQLKAQGIYIDKLGQEAEAVRVLGEAMRSAFEGEFGVDSSDGRASAYFTDFQEGIHTTLPLLDEWQIKLSEIDNKVAELGHRYTESTGKQLSTESLDKYRAKLVWLAEYKGIQELQKSINDLNFSTVINGLREAGSGTDVFDDKVRNVAASYMELKEKAYEAANKAGQAFKDLDGNIQFTGKEGVDNFEAMIKNSGLFKNAIKELNKEIRNMKDELSDSSFTMDQDIAALQAKLSPRYNEGQTQWDLGVQAARHYQVEAKKAIDGTAEGQARAVAMLEQAYNSIKNLDDQGNKTDIAAKIADMRRLQGEIEKLKQVDIDAADSAKGKLTAGQEANNAYIEGLKSKYGEAGVAVEGYGKILNSNGAAMAAWEKNQITAVDKVIQKWQELGKNSILTPEGLSIEFPEGTLASVIEKAKEYGNIVKSVPEDTVVMASNTKEALEGIKGSWEDLGTGTEGVQTITDEYGENVIAWSKQTIKVVNETTAAWRTLAEVIRNMPTPKAPVPSNISGARASGGPVNSGQSYLVGEKGPEIFSPRTSGDIIPNNQLTKGSSDRMVDINFNIGNGKSVPLQGPQSSVDELFRQMKDKARYAS